ncbi:MAG: hypothetical protein L6R39_001821 [Caloplaca ligustica]|nr:MAG: hypothetical protein L6R39_001821 [Caloplaca ligustica]
MASDPARFPERPEGDEPGEVDSHVDSSHPPVKPYSPPSLITSPFFLDLFHKVGINDIDAEDPPEELPNLTQKGSRKRAFQFAMPTDPTNPALLKDLVPPDQYGAAVQAAFDHVAGRTSGKGGLSLRAPRGGSASIQRGRKRTHSAAKEGKHDNPGPPAKVLRGGPRTRYHPAPGHAGIARRHAQEEGQPTAPFIHEGALQRSNPGARATSRSVHFAPEQPPSCHEQPSYWSVGPGFIESSEADTIHSAPVQPCSQTELHGNKSYYVCASCRIRARKHREQHFNAMGQQPRSLPLCDHCSNHNLTLWANPANVEDGGLKKLGCTCRNEWMCFECALRDMDFAKVKYDTELELRRGLGTTGVLDGVRCVSIITYCICGERLNGTEQTWRCTCCLGIGIM